MLFWIMITCSLEQVYKPFGAPHPSTPKIKTAGHSETLISAYESTRRRNPGDRSIRFHLRETHKASNCFH
jgi:hypothetical protein